MTTPPRIFDETLRQKRRERADRSSTEAENAPMRALHAHVADSLVERLAPINRRFATVLIAATTTNAYANALRQNKDLDSLTQLEASPCIAQRLRSAADAKETVILGALGEELPAHEALAAGRFDLVILGPDLHARNDPIAALSQARLLLKPDGLLLAVMFGGETLKELRACFAEAEVEICGGLSPRIAPMGEIRDLGALLQRAGFALPVADSERVELWHPSPLHLMQEIRAVGESNALQDRRRAFLRRDVLARCLELYQQRFSRPDGKTRATVELVTLTGWAPSPDQQQPLRPGAAKTRLAEALGTQEQPVAEPASSPGSKSAD